MSIAPVPGPPGEVSSTVEEPHHYVARVESIATRAALVAFGAALLVAGVVIGGDRRPLAGDESVGAVASWVSAVFAAVAVAGAFLHATKNGYAPWRRRIPVPRRIIDIVAVTAGMATLAYFSVLAAARVFQLGFIGLTVDAMGGAVLVAAAAAALTYVAALAGARVSGEGLALLATLVLLTGTMASMLTTPDESWWQLHFSQLGNVAELSGYRFNLGLIVTGAVLTALAGFIGHDIDLGLTARGRESPALTKALSGLFAAMGVCLATAGFVPDAVSVPIHVGAASGMVVVFIVFVALLLRLPGLPREVAAVSLLVIAGIVTAAVLWVPIGYYNLTGTEFVAAALLFGWLTMFVRAIGAYARPSRHVSAPS
ncbi:hypothetical protein GCM10027416_11260 [Okibacterium endophyticum]